jgi:hypothetical protein
MFGSDPAGGDADDNEFAGIEDEYRRRIAALRRLPRHARTAALRAARDTRAAARRALGQKRAASRRHRRANKLGRRSGPS